MTDDRLYERVAQILEQARGQVACTVNTAMVQAYRQIGREIVEGAIHQALPGTFSAEETRRARPTRAASGKARKVPPGNPELAQRFPLGLLELGKGFSLANRFRVLQVYLAFPKGSATLNEPNAIFSTPARKSPAWKQPTMTAGGPPGQIRQTLSAKSGQIIRHLPLKSKGMKRDSFARRPRVFVLKYLVIKASCRVLPREIKGFISR